VTTAGSNIKHGVTWFDIELIQAFCIHVWGRDIESHLGEPLRSIYRIKSVSECAPWNKIENFDFTSETVLSANYKFQELCEPI
jgi:hypothetical protein